MTQSFFYVRVKLFFIIFFFMSLTSYSQNGILFGDVYCKQNNILLDSVTIKIISSDSSIIRTFTTDTTGNFYFKDLKPTTYNLYAYRKGYKKKSVCCLEVNNITGCNVVLDLVGRNNKRE
jgi:Carboxypeptidase regulatory-like domain